MSIRTAQDKIRQTVKLDSGVIGYNYNQAKMGEFSGCKAKNNIGEYEFHEGIIIEILPDKIENN